LTLPTEVEQDDPGELDNFPDLENPFFNKFLPSEQNS
jgi:hypothetical protein